VSPRSIHWTAAACAVLLLGAALRYIVRHPLPIGYDEAMYVNQVLFDRDVLLNDGLVAFARKQVGTETWRPPGYRLAAAPVALLAGPSTPALRLLSMGSLLLTALLLFLAGREITGLTVGVVWAAAVGLASGPLRGDVLFGTETTLYPAIAGALLGITRWLCRGKADRLTCAILFLSAAAGGLSKLSFLVVFLPMAAMAAWLAPGSRRAGMLAIAGGLALIAPWWWFNWRDALHYAGYASRFARHGFPWLTSAVDELIGVPFTLGLVAALVVGIRSARATTVAASGPPRALIVTCLAGVIPLTLLHVMGDNHNMRLLSPAWIPTAGIVILMLHMAGTFEQPLGRRITALVIAAQAVVMTATIWGWASGQRDWRVLRTLTEGQRPEDIRIAHIGDALALNSPQILYAWRRSGETIDLDRLWRWESGPIRWDRVLPRVDSADVVVIPLDRALIEPPGQEDNVHNLELTRRLLAEAASWTVDTLPRIPTDTNSYVLFIRRSP
jgi:hypothetical protein